MAISPEKYLAAQIKTIVLTSTVSAWDIRAKPSLQRIFLMYTFSKSALMWLSS